MTTHGNHRTEKNWSRHTLPTLNDINAKLSYVIQLLREERQPDPLREPRTERLDEENGETEST